NPFNTTQSAPGASSYNSVGVRNYQTPDQGVMATVQTLQNGRYGNIIQAMKAGKDPIAMAKALAASPWGTGALVLKVLGAAPTNEAPPSTPTIPTAHGASNLTNNLQGVSQFPQAPNPLGSAPSALQTLLSNAAPSALGMRSLQNLGGLAAKTAQAAQADIPVPTLGALPSTKPPPLPSAPLPDTTGQGPTGNPPAAGDVSKWVNTAAGADRQGVSTVQGVRDFVSQVAQVWGHPLTITTGTNHHQWVSGENHVQSQHWTGQAADIAFGHGTSSKNIDPQLTKLGQDALIAAGADPKWARKQTGGVYNIGPYNILFNTYVGGNHYNHLHVGI